MNPLCAEAREELDRQALSAMFDSDDDNNNLDNFSSKDTPENESIEPRDGVPFLGDALGTASDYEDDNDDFGQGNDEEDREEQIQRALDAEQEDAWEPERALHTSETDGTARDKVCDAQAGDFDDAVNSELEDMWLRSAERADAHPHIVRYSEQYPLSKAGSIIRYEEPGDIRYRKHISHANPSVSSVWAPFTSEVDWRVAKWAKLRGAGSTAFSELLAIDGLVDALNLSYKSITDLNRIIDTELPKRPAFHRHEVVVANESFELYARDIVECIRALWADPEFLPYLQFEPERHYTDKDQTMRMYHDMHTGKWWWATQKRVEEETKKKGITIIPIILSSDKTQLTTFRNKSAYPLYLTIGNLPKHIRRKPSRQGQILVAYLPTSNLKHIQNKSARRRATANLFHACVRFILSPLETLGKTGLHLTSGDGAVRDGHPIVAAMVNDYPEQVLATGVKTGDCPTCPIPRKDIGNPDLVQPPRNMDDILDAVEVQDYSTPQAFNRACKEVGIKPIQHPFWQHLPFLNIFRSITPDILHQLYQGNIKHLLGWLQEALGEDEIDARCRRLPPNHNIRLFLKGISHLSRVTGAEHDQICRFILGIIDGIKIPGVRSTAPLIRATRAMLDFLYLAKYPVHTSETLLLLENSLKTYHDNRHIFIDLGIRQDFNFPKDHFINHYRELIEIFGTADNFNTEYSHCVIMEVGGG